MSEQIRRAVLTYTRQPGYKPTKPRVIGERLGLEGDDLLAVRKVIKKLVKEGELEFGPGHLVMAVGEGAIREAAVVPGGQVLPPKNTSKKHGDDRHIRYECIASHKNLCMMMFW